MVSFRGYGFSFAAAHKAENDDEKRAALPKVMHFDKNRLRAFKAITPLLSVSPCRNLWPLSPLPFL
jgi:hypothetical protein